MRVASEAAAMTARTMSNTGPRRHATARKDIRAAKVNGSPPMNVTAGLWRVCAQVQGIRSAKHAILHKSRKSSNRRPGQGPAGGGRGEAPLGLEGRAQPVFQHLRL